MSGVPFQKIWHSFKILLIFMCIGILYACISMHDMCAWYLQRAEKRHLFPGTEVAHCFELPYGY